LNMGVGLSLHSCDAPLILPAYPTFHAGTRINVQY
jgi:hypothetical protein